MGTSQFFPAQGAVAGGDVNGPGSSTDNALARWDGAAGDTLQNSPVTLSDAGALGLPSDVRQTFMPGSTNAGLNIGQGANFPSSPTDGDLFYYTTTKTVYVRVNGVWVALAMSGALGVFKARVQLTNAQVQSLNTSPVTIVPAPGAGLYIGILGMWAIKDTAAGAYSGASTVRLEYDGVATDLTVALNLFLSSANVNWFKSDIIAVTGGAASPPSSLNKAVVVISSADVTGGNAANYVIIETVYFIGQGA